MSQQELIEKITREWAAKGKILEGGWLAYAATGMALTTDPAKLAELRKAYFLGAQHLFASIMGMFDPGSDATEGDLRRMDLIHAELQAFEESLRAPSRN